MARIGPALAALLVGCGAATPVAPSASAADEAVETPTPSRPLFVWVVRSPDGAESTFVGTFHAGVSIDRAVPAPHADRIANARALVLEIDPATMQSQAFRERIVLGSDQRLSEILPPDVWGALEQTLAVPSAALDRLQPWAAMSMLMLRDLDAEAAPGSAAGEQPARLDQQIAEAATANDVPIVALETVQEQADLFASLPLDDVVESLRLQLFREGNDEHPTVEELREMYLSGDLEQIEGIVLDPEEIAATPAVYERLFFARNARWVDALRDPLAEGGVVCAVGLGHLLGDRGVLAALEREGFTIERLNAE